MPFNFLTTMQYVQKLFMGFSLLSKQCWQMKLLVQRPLTYAQLTLGTTTSFLIHLNILDQLNNAMILPSPNDLDSISISYQTPALTQKPMTILHRDIHQRHRNKLLTYDRFTMGEHDN
jgi:hypothetical protein